MSSPVALAGPGNHNTTASSIGCRSAFQSNARVAIRGEGIRPASEISAVPACDPDTRTMEMALGGRPDESAKMVCSRGYIAYLFQSPLRRQCNFRFADFRRTGTKPPVRRLLLQHFFAGFMLRHWGRLVGRPDPRANF